VVQYHQLLRQDTDLFLYIQKKQRKLGKEGLQLFNSALGHSNNNKRGSVLPALPPRNNVIAKTKTNRTKVMVQKYHDHNDPHNGRYIV
jgi:hypothetical protein